MTIKRYSVLTVEATVIKCVPLPLQILKSYCIIFGAFLMLDISVSFLYYEGASPICVIAGNILTDMGAWARIQ